MAQLTIPAGDFAAYLFDLDGTVADSMPIHYRAWSQAIEEAGGKFPRDEFYAMGGIPLIRTVEILNERHGYAMDPQAVVARKESLYYELMHDLKPMASVMEQVAAAYGRIPLAIVSGSPCESIRRTLDHLQLADRFAVVIGSEDYVHGKPDPEPFLLAAERLRVPPAKCLVFEDAEAGIQAAKAAGMQWVLVPQPNAAV